jgi:hypothetical protein
MTKPIDPQAAIESMWKIAPEYAKAKAERVYLEEFTRVKKALLMKECGETAVSAQERDALAHPDFAVHLEGLRTAVEREEVLRWRLVSAQTAVEVWRSQNASNRAIDRAAA